MKVIYAPSERSNFHNQADVRLVITGKRTAGYLGEDAYVISKRHAKRIEDHFCGMRDCCCQKGGVMQIDPEGEEFCIAVSDCEGGC